MTLALAGAARDTEGRLSISSAHPITQSLLNDGVAIAIASARMASTSGVVKQQPVHPCPYVVLYIVVLCMSITSGQLPQLMKGGGTLTSWRNLKSTSSYENRPVITRRCLKTGRIKGVGVRFAQVTLRWCQCFSNARPQLGPAPPVHQGRLRKALASSTTIPHKPTSRHDRHSISGLRKDEHNLLQTLSGMLIKMLSAPCAESVQHGYQRHPVRLASTALAKAALFLVPVQNATSVMFQVTEKHLLRDLRDTSSQFVRSHRAIQQSP